MTLQLYIGRRIAAAILLTFLGTLLLVFVVDFVELLRRASDAKDSSIATLALLSAERTPAVTERALPFAVLFAAIAAFLQLSRKLELVVARAAGMSIWQMLVPALGAAVLIGVVATTIYNPISANLRERSTALEARVLGASMSGTPAQRYIRQRSVDGESILRARVSSDQGRTLEGVIAFVFSKDGVFQERVEATRAVLAPGYWTLENARVMRPGRETEAHDAYLLPTNLTANQVNETLTRRRRCRSGPCRARSHSGVRQAFRSPVLNCSFRRCWHGRCCWPP